MTPVLVSLELMLSALPDVFIKRYVGLIPSSIWFKPSGYLFRRPLDFDQFLSRGPILPIDPLTAFIVSC